MNHAPSTGSIARPFNQQSRAPPLYHGRPTFYNIPGTYQNNPSSCSSILSDDPLRNIWGPDPDSIATLNSQTHKSRSKMVTLQKMDKYMTETEYQWYSQSGDRNNILNPTSNVPLMYSRCLVIEYILEQYQVFGYKISIFIYFHNAPIPISLSIMPSCTFAYKLTNFHQI